MSNQHFCSNLRLSLCGDPPSLLSLHQPKWHSQLYPNDECKSFSLTKQVLSHQEQHRNKEKDMDNFIDASGLELNTKNDICRWKEL